MARVLINLPQTAKRDEIIEIKTLIAHPRETGYRLDSKGAAIPRDIINRFVCIYNGTEVFRAELFPAIAANPFIAFSTVAIESGELAFAWPTTRAKRKPKPGSLPSHESLICGDARTGRRNGSARRGYARGAAVGL